MTTGAQNIRHAVNDAFFDTVGVQQAWLIGFLAADGNVERGGRCWSISQAGEDGRRVLEAVRAMIGFAGALQTRGPATVLRVNSPRMVARLAEFGVVPAKPLIYGFPANLAPALIPAFLRGYVEGDGSAGVYHSGTASDPVLSFVGTCQFVEVTRTHTPRRGKWRTIRRAANLAEVRWYDQEAPLVADWLWANPDLPPSRKREITIAFLADHVPRYAPYHQRKQATAALLAAGVSVPEVVARLGVPFQTVCKWRASQKGDTCKSI